MSGTDQTIYTELRTRYNAGWTPVTTEFPNEEFTRPTNAIWARFTIKQNPEEQLDIGSEVKTFRTAGFLIIQLFAPMNTGTIAVRASADTLAGVFRNWSGTTVTCREAAVRDIGNDPNGFYQINVTVPFKTDVLH